MTETFDNPRQVSEYLKGIGVKVSERTVYNHERIGKLTRGPDGKFSVAAVKKYADTWLADNGAGADPARQSEKQDEELRKLKADADLREFKLGILSKKYIERERFERELAARAMVIRSDMENFFRSRAPEIIARVDGKSEFAPDLIDYLLENLETWIGRYSADVEFKTPVESTG
jgi:hypothetical protein